MATVTQIRRVFNPRRSSNPLPMLIELGAINPRKETMAKRKYRKSNARTHRTRARASHRRTASNPHHRRRSRNVMMRHSRRRRSHNPMMGGLGTKMLGGLGGVAATGIVASFIPASVTASLPASIAPIALAAGAAALVGFAAHKFVGGPMGEAIIVGAAMSAGAVALTTLVPSLSTYANLTPGQLAGLGAIIPGRYVVPQNPVTSPGPQSQIAAPAGTGMGVAAFPRAF